MLAAAGAVVGLWVGATRHTGPVARGYRWLGAAAFFWCAGLIVDAVVAGSVSSSGEPLGLADVAPLLGLAAAATGIMVLASPSSHRASQQGEHPEHGTSGSVLPGLADGYVMAVALLVIGWVVAFGSEFHRSGERPSTFLLDLLHPLADLAVLIMYSDLEWYVTISLFEIYLCLHQNTRYWFQRRSSLVLSIW